ncbi:alkane 1-monooxygenase [Ruegeria marina]|uniref:Alkane 1-monooxygenase n=1 Tax=Ruegeria marina TaxID=639004 RepID=A0A1G6KRU2_9RHOB|nr:alkane 1-monooxygenase [Ruegeria marina]SDC33066.1 alkane 1-monooxygenase [Ruegeria marina]
MYRYILASLLPYAVLGGACLTGGGWAWVALLSMTVYVAVLDKLPVRPLPAADWAGARVLPWVLALAHFTLLALAIPVLAHGPLTGAQAVALGIAVALCFGQVSNSNAHELIHRGDRWQRWLGAAIYTSLLFGHHVSAHMRVHHIWVATPRDPNSARFGQGFWVFLPRAWIGSFRAGLAAERALRQGRGATPYRAYVLGAGATVAAAWLLAGGRGVVVLLLLAGYAQIQLLLADYIQHYGLRREALADGRYEPARARHSWNAPHWYSSAMMLNAPRHSDHHQNPTRDFAALRLDPDMPQWPYAMPIMAVLATVPPLWRRVMDPRVRDLAGKSE